MADTHPIRPPAAPEGTYAVRMTAVDHHRVVDGTPGADAMAGTARNDDICAAEGADRVAAGAGHDRVWGDTGDDTLDGGAGNDLLVAGRGSDSLLGGDGDDVLLARSDAGEPMPAMGGRRQTDPSALAASASDTLVGGAGADVFRFEILLNAVPETLAEHTLPSGEIDWGAIPPENDFQHEHWLNGVGHDVIADFRHGVDRIEIASHAFVYDLSRGRDAGGDFTLISIFGHQGGGTGHGGVAHHMDALGDIKVYGDPVLRRDIVKDRQDANMGEFVSYDGTPYGDGDECGVLPDQSWIQHNTNKIPDGGYVWA